MRKNLTISGLVALLTFFGLSGIAQDIHFSQFLYSPLNLNPAMAGNFDGRYRVAFNYRNQWSSISKAFQTTSISGDARDFLNVKNFGVGAVFYYDVAGTSRYRTLKFGVPLSYRFNLTKDSVHSIIPGISPSFNHQGIDVSNLNFNEQYNGNRYDPNRSTNENFDIQNQNYFDLALGFAYNLRLKNQMNFTAGLGVHNLLTPKENYLNGTEAPLENRYSFHVGGFIPIHPKWFLTPGILHMRQAEYRQTAFGTEINYLHHNNPYRYRAFFVGAWNRGKDAAILDLGMYYNTWRFGVSYDINYSSLNVASNSRGGWEVSIIYILRDLLPKRTNFKFCPNYI